MTQLTDGRPNWLCGLTIIDCDPIDPIDRTVTRTLANYWYYYWRKVDQWTIDRRNYCDIEIIEPARPRPLKQLDDDSSDGRWWTVMAEKATQTDGRASPDGDWPRPRRTQLLDGRTIIIIDRRAQWTGRYCWLTQADVDPAIERTMSPALLWTQPRRTLTRTAQLTLVLWPSYWPGTRLLTQWPSSWYWPSGGPLVSIID